jgi:hypothetical protein
VPSPTYIRVFPFGSSVTENSARSVFSAGLRAVLIWVQLAASSVERHTPPFVLIGARLFCGNADA